MARKPLDNPVWHALGGPQAGFALKRPHARRFDPEVAPFFAIEEPSDRAYRDIGDLLGKSPEARLFRPEKEPAPPGWSKTFEKPIDQMILPPTAALPAALSSIIELREADAPAMQELAKRADPGPFAPRTRELGTYLGIHDGERLVAMAGERLRLPGWIEISAVAVDKEYRGRGFGRALSGALVARIRAAGQMPFLHVYPDNKAAFALYKAMGFVQRTTLVVTWLAPKAPPPPAEGDG
jgi:ribosomal protein S18 acetylase RimI-like enzyme